jgi:hypothetical protein
MDLRARGSLLPALCVAMTCVVVLALKTCGTEALDGVVAIASADSLPTVDSPPDDTCSSILDTCLAEMQVGSEGVDQIVRSDAAMLVAPGVRSVMSGDDEWNGLPRGDMFVDRFVVAPPGLAPSALHRAGDLNPDDRYISPECRASIESVVLAYNRALQQARAKCDQAKDSEIASAKASGLAIITKVVGDRVRTTKGRPGERFVMTYEAGDSGGLDCISIRLSDLPRYAYIDGLYWHIARECGTQIVAIYSSLGLMPSDYAALCTKRIVDACGRFTR